jgi:hypothetical protein
MPNSSIPTSRSRRAGAGGVTRPSLGRAVLVAVLAALAVGWGPAEPAAACSCAESDVRTAVEGADAVFIGTVEERAATGLPWDTGSRTERRFLLEVQEVVKGEAHERQAVFSSGDDGSCGFELVGDGPFAVFADREDGDRYRSDLCSGNTEATAALAAELAELAEDDARLLPGSSPYSGWFTPRRALASGGVALLAGLVGWLAVRRRRRRAS